MDNNFAIYCDMDGVIADYTTGIRRLGFNPDPAKAEELNRSGSQNPLKREMYEMIKGTRFYEHLPILPGAAAIWRLISLAEPILLTASPKFGATEDDFHLNPYWLGAAFCKRNWIERKFLPHVMGVGRDDYIEISDERFICTTSARKQEFMHRKKSKHQILIDDRRDNCIAWARAGGIAIFHDPANWMNTRRALQTFHAYLADPEYGFVPHQDGFIWGLDDHRTWAEMRTDHAPA